VSEAGRAEGTSSGFKPTTTIPKVQMPTVEQANYKIQDFSLKLLQKRALHKH